MSFGSRRVFERMATVVNKRLTNCTVEIGSSTGWASQIEQTPVAPLASDDAANLQYAGMYSAYYAEALDTEGYTLSVSLPSIVPIGGHQFDAHLYHGDRLAIKLDETPEIPRLICAIRNSRPDGRYRVLHYLSALGPECADSVKAYYGFPYTFPIVFGDLTFDSCALLSAENPNRL